MPRIPMAEKAGLIRHVSDTVHMTGAPGLNWKLDEGQALIDMGEKIGRGAERLGNTMMAFAQHMQGTEDRLNATRIESLWKDRQSALETRMAENPGEYEKFAEWAHETDTDFVEASKPFRDKMSQRSLELFDARMDGIRKETYNRRKTFAVQARVTADYNLFQSQWKDAALRGDLESCNKMLEEHRGKLISQQEYDQKKLDFGRLSAFGEVKRLVDAGSPDIIGKLKERDKDGNYVNYTGLAVADRDRFIRVAEANDAQRRSDENQMLVDKLNNGYQITPEDIEQEFEGQETPEAIRQKNQQRKIVENFVSRQSARRAEARKGQVDSDEYKLLAYNFSSDPAVRQKQYSELKDAIFVKYAGDGASTKKLLTQLDETFKAKTNPDSSYKNSYIYAYGDKILQGMKNDFYSRYPGRGEKWYSFLTNVYNDEDKDMSAANWKMAKVAFDDFIRRNPEASEKDVTEFLNQLKKDVNWAECDKIVDFWRDRKTPRVGMGKTDVNGGNRGNGAATLTRAGTDGNGGNGAATQAGLEIERDVNGRVAIFGADHKFIRWKDGK